jgi:cytochrome c oxidase cbb3-type subunit 4
MDTYSLLRQIADSWMLLALFVFFIAAVVWAFRPGSKAVHRDSANIPFRHDDKPAAPDIDRGNEADATQKEART